MNLKPVVDPSNFMAWAMENKLQLASTARAKITRAVRVLYMKGKVPKEDYEKYIRLTKAHVQK